MSDSNILKYKGQEYLQALTFSQEYASSDSPKEGYVTPETTSKKDRIIIQQNNTIIALLSSLHYRIGILETNIKNYSASSKIAPDIVENIRNISLGQSKDNKKNIQRKFIFQNYE